jgi:hypothetical protein
MLILTFVLSASLASAASMAPRLTPAPAVLAAPAVASDLLAAPPVALAPARTMLGIREDADRLWGKLAILHSRAQSGEASVGLRILKRSMIADFDGVVASLPDVPAVDGATPSEQIKSLHRQRRTLVEALKTTDGDRRTLLQRHAAELSGVLAILQLRVARGLLHENSPLRSKSLRRNAAISTLLGAHNSASRAAIEALRVEAVDKAAHAFGDSRTLQRWNHWFHLHAQIEAAALHARNGRPEEARAKLGEVVAILRDGGRDAADLAAADRLERLAATPDSPAILAAKDLVAHPDIKTLTHVEYADLSAKRRSFVHALVGGHEEHVLTLSHETAVREAAADITAPHATAGDIAQARARLAVVLEWSGGRRVRVAEKRLCAQNLRAALAALDEDDLALAARHAERAADFLAQRRATLAAQGHAVRERLLRSL